MLRALSSILFPFSYLFRHRHTSNEPATTFKDTLLHTNKIKVAPFEPPQGVYLSELEIEKINARRALRIAGWSSIFVRFF
jgi:hypothetical protein